MNKSIYSFIFLFFISIISLFAQNKSFVNPHLDPLHLPPDPKFTYTGVCFGDSTRFINLTKFAGYIERWYLYGNSGLIDSIDVKNLTYKFQSVGNYTVTLYEDNGHQAYKTTYPIRIDTLPQVEIKYSGICHGDTTFMISEAECTDSVKWVVSDSLTSTILFTSSDTATSYSFASAGWYKVKLYGYNSSGMSSDSITFYIYDKPVADFVIPNVCANDTMFFQNTSICGKQFYWSFGDTVTGVNNFSTDFTPLHLFNDTGFYSITLITTNAFGSDTLIQQVHIWDHVPDVKFTYTVSGDTVFFKNESTYIVGCIWDFRNGSLSYNMDTAIHVYPGPGEYEVILYAYSNCFGRLDTDTVVISPVGIKDLTPATGFSFYPNPTQGKVNIELSKAMVVDIEVYNELGILISKLAKGNATRFIELKENQLTTGINIIKLNTEQGTFYRKIIVAGEN